ncbi:uncharacterized protein M421DRAFT_73626 [Didymella exigua CBS 183.55]|uniref:Nudix hydrolase domain-containing protein n=1 Tax=Didymella exigua CBS 183.55 TaxID=1150837 RepID=A0A6A5R756_9PLEO|nr:uncharacterized protein M421DRAFT_73626 [Didymella exigua CBS 183.55]KAF1924011.1 hypothetical protein M421DRAFT_73626 [Didymella exigua CBS 183.55]
MPRTVESQPPSSSEEPVFAQFSGEDLVVGGGVAIFHIASTRVVICSAPRKNGKISYFLPKGRRDAGEDNRTGAEREGYEESGYRNRLLPLPTSHRQPQAHPRVASPPLTAEPVWMQLMPLGYYNMQYVLYWYIAETLPPDLEDELETEVGGVYRPPPAYPNGLTLKERVRQEPREYEPRHHEGTGVDEEEAAYDSHLVSVEEAVRKLGGRGSVMADVVMRGWKGIQDRFAMEETHDATTQSPEVMH